MLVRNHMTTPPITVTPDTDFKVAMGLMQRHRIRRLPVVDAVGALAGIVAERDLLAAADRYLHSVADVGDIMTRKVVTVARSTPVVVAASLMVGLKIGGLPVVDASNKVLGIITETDLLKALAGLLDKTPVVAASSKKAAGKNRLASQKTAPKTLARQRPRQPVATKRPARKPAAKK